MSIDAATYQQLREQLRAELSAPSNALQEQLQELRATVALLQQQNTQLQASNSRSPSHPKPRLQDPDKFTGETHDYPTWIASIRAKLAVDSQAIGDETAKFYYVFLNLAAKVQKLVLPQLSIAQATHTWSFETILTQLERVFNDPNRVQKAEEKLPTIKQGGQTFAYFFPKFERGLYEADGYAYPDNIKISLLRSALSDSMKRRLKGQLTLPAKYDEFVKVLQQLADDTPFTPSNNYSNNSHASDSHAPRTPHFPQSVLKRNDPDAMDMSNMNIGNINLSNINKHIDKINKDATAQCEAMAGKPNSGNDDINAIYLADKEYYDDLYATEDEDDSSDDE